MSVHEIEMNRKPCIDMRHDDNPDFPPQRVMTLQNRKPVRIPREQVPQKPAKEYVESHFLSALSLLVKMYPQKAKELAENELSKLAA